MNTEHKSNTDPSIRDLWQTPPKLFKALNNEFGFTLDVAASADNHLCSNYFDDNIDALSLYTWGR